MKITILLPLAVMFLTGCGNPQQTLPAKSVSTQTMTDAIPTGSKINEKDIDPSNPGFKIDLDGDGTVDFVIMRKNNTIYFQRSCSGPEVALTTLKADIRAYSFAPHQNSKLPVFLFWDSNLNGYYMPNLGAVNGIPRFGTIESQ